MKIDLKKPKYVLPLIILPFSFLLFYSYKSFSKGDTKKVEKQEGLKMDITGVSDKIKKTSIPDKLDAYRDKYKEGDKYTAVNNVAQDSSNTIRLTGSYNEREKYILDSIDAAFKAKYSQGAQVNGKHYIASAHSRAVNSSHYRQGSEERSLSGDDRELATALAAIKAKKEAITPTHAPASGADKDPMEVFRQQMGIIDSMGKANDPDIKAQKQRELLMNKIDVQSSKMPKLAVSKVAAYSDEFNTIVAPQKNDFIKAIIDQSLTGYAGSRVRIRLLEDIKAGKETIKRGTYVYALISGFEEQRVKLTITSVMSDSKILPVKLEIYDLDGMKGLYVPASAFRAFTKEISDIGSSVQMQQDPSSTSQLYMSAISKIFSSTSTAVSAIIRKNKAKLKYSTYLYLIDPDELKADQKTY